MELRLMAVGDVITHLEIVRAAKGKGYGMFFEQMLPEFNKADLLIGNQETGLTDNVEPSGFPVFATPTAVGIAENEAGFDLLTLATNHTLDRRAEGLSDAVSFWKKQTHAKAIGIRKDKDRSEFASSENLPYLILEKTGIRVAFLNYTAPTNFHKNPSPGEHFVPLLRKKYQKAILEEIELAKKDSDFLVVCVHWGVEYLYEPIKKQRKWANFLAEAGADLIIGTHPHVVEPLETMQTSDGREVPVFFSLGNYISCQCFPGTLLGGLADVTLFKEGEKCHVTGDLKPLIAHADENGFTVYPLDTYTEELCAHNIIAQNIAKKFKEPVTVASVRALFQAINNRTAIKTARLKKPIDVFFYDAGRVIKYHLKKTVH